MANTGNYQITAKIIPEYDLATAWLQYETESQCDEGQRRVIATLSEHNFSDGDEYLAGPYDAAIKKLRHCRKGGPACQSPACPVCFSTFRRWFVSQGLKAFENDKNLLFVTWVPDPLPPHLPFTFNPAVFEQRFQRRLATALRPDVRRRIKVWGFIEFSLSRALNWIVPHIHAIVSGCTEAHLRPIGRRWSAKKSDWVLPKNRVIQRPLEITQVKGDRMELFSYIVKNYMRQPRQYKPYIAKKPESAKRRGLREGAREVLKRHRRFGFTSDGYRRYASRAAYRLKGTALDAEFFSFLSGLSLHDLPVLARMARSHVRRTLDFQEPRSRGRTHHIRQHNRRIATGLKHRSGRVLNGGRRNAGPKYGFF